MAESIKSAPIICESAPAPELFVKLNETAILPTRATSAAAGWDLYAPHGIRVPQNGDCVRVNLGIRVNLPPGHFGQIRIRSSMFLNHCLEVGAGTIDNDYKGDIGVLLYCTRYDPGPKEISTVSCGNQISTCYSEPNSVYIAAGSRFAQIIIIPYWDGGVKAVGERAAENGGFGSTGK